MLEKGPARKVTIYVNEDASYHGTPLYDAIISYLHNKGVAGATATRAMAGFGSHRVKHSAAMEATAEHLGIRIEFVERADRIDALLPTLYDMVSDGLIEMQDTFVVKATPRPGSHTRPATHDKKSGRAKMMRLFMGESDRSEGEPLYEAILKRFRLLDIDGATVYRGILGYGAKRHTHKSGFLHLSHDLPIMISVVDTQEKLDRALAAIEPMLTDALIVFSDVDYVRLVRPAPEATTDASS